jgi:FMN phosphatase YigB (HAD superfamily)
MRNIVLDVGGVLVQPRYGPFVEYLAAAGADVSDLRTWAALVGLEHHESGKLNGARFLERIATTVQRALDPMELERRWLDMFVPDEEMFALARALTAGHRVFLLSNVGDLHWAHLDERYGLASLVHGALPSCQAGVLKPDAAIYRAAEAEFELDPAQTVFIDDLALNVAGARSCGWSAIQHSSAAETRASLAALGVRVPDTRSPRS